jgi:hypothetical protein
MARHLFVNQMVIKVVYQLAPNVPRIGNFCQNPGIATFSGYTFQPRWPPTREDVALN